MNKKIKMIAAVIPGRSIAEQLKAARAGESNGGATTQVRSAGPVKFFAIPGDVQGEARTREVLGRQLRALAREIEDARRGGAEIAEAAGEMSQEELARKIDQWGLRFEKRCACAECRKRPESERVWWTGRTVSALVYVQSNHEVRLAPSEALTAAVREEQERAGSLEEAFGELQREVSAGGEMCVELVSKDTGMLRYFAALLSKNGAGFDMGVDACECGRAGCWGKLVSLRMSEATLAALGRAVRRAVEKGALSGRTAENSRLFANLLRANAFLQAAHGGSPEGEVRRRGLPARKA